MTDPTFDTVRRVIAAAEPMWRDAAADQLARDIVHALPAKVAPTDDAVERAARAGTGPTPCGAADVLREHRYDDTAVAGPVCECGSWVAADWGLSAYPEFAQHQEDMLAAAGLLATAEHDAQVLRDAGDEIQLVDVARHGNQSADDNAEAAASAWLAARADRIAGGAA